MKKSLSIIIPCYNEQSCILPLFEKIEQIISQTNEVEIVIVDNGSTDDSSKIIKEHDLFKQNKISLLTIEENIGYGHGIISGLKKSSGDYMSWCHSDLEIDPVYAWLAFKKHKSELFNNNLIIKGKRISRSILDLLFTEGMSLIASIIFKTKLRDINAQPKIFSKSFFNLLINPPNDFSLDLYFLVVARYNNYSIKEFPVEVKKRISGEAKGGGGSFLNKLKLTKKTLKYIIDLKKYLKIKKI
tara:strand:+ start:2246 stop:2974 length:729 start_codon:yes stop_codon:yes gene_type:complete